MACWAWAVVDARSPAASAAVRRPAVTASAPATSSMCCTAVAHRLTRFCSVSQEAILRHFGSASFGVFAADTTASLVKEPTGGSAYVSSSRRTAPTSLAQIGAATATIVAPVTTAAGFAPSAP